MRRPPRPELGHRFEEGLEILPSMYGKKVWDVLGDNPSRIGVTASPEKFEHEASALRLDSTPVASSGILLAGKSPNGNVNCSTEATPIKLRHVTDVRHVREPLCKNRRWKLLNLRERKWGPPKRTPRNTCCFYPGTKRYVPDCISPPYTQRRAHYRAIIHLYAVL